MSRFINNLLIGAGSIASLFPQAPIRRQIVRSELPRLTKSEREALEADWRELGQDLQTVISRDEQKTQTF